MPDVGLAAAARPVALHRRRPPAIAPFRKLEAQGPGNRVRFRQREVWPDYAGRTDDTIEIEIYQHWLEPEDKR